MFVTIKGVLAAAIAANATFIASLPGNGSDLKAAQAAFPVSAGNLHNAFGHSLAIGSNQPLSFPVGFDVALTSSSTVTITNKTASTWQAGTPFILQLEMKGYRLYQDNDPGFARKLMNMTVAGLFLVNLGMPATASATAACAAQAGVNGNLTLNGGQLVGSAICFDVPRGVQAVSTNAGDTTQVLAIYGTDAYGQPMRENITLNGTTIVQGNKAFNTITRIGCSAATAGNVTVGNSTKLGLPVAVASAGYVMKELQDGAAATAGTFAYAVRTAGGSTATTGDVRGTYIPNTVPDGTKTYELLVCLPDPGNIGIPQFNG